MSYKSVKIHVTNKSYTSIHATVILASTVMSMSLPNFMNCRTFRLLFSPQSLVNHAVATQQVQISQEVCGYCYNVFIDFDWLCGNFNVN